MPGRDFLLEKLPMRNSSIMMATLVASLCVGVAVGERRVYVPTEDDTVIETLRTRPFGKTDAELRRLRSNSTPDDPAEAFRLARLHLDRYRLDQDPRDLGNVEALIKPWTGGHNELAEALILRATVRQSLHDFDGALGDLKLALRRDPGNRQALLTKSVIHQVRGEWREARACAAALAISGNDLATETCIASIAGLTGSAASGERLLASALDQAGEAASTEERVWALTLRGEIAARTGNHELARNAYTKARDLAPGDLYLAAAACDLELETGNDTAALSVLPVDANTDGILLRRIIAKKNLRAPDCQELAAQYEERIAASALRGDRVHLREEARYLLEVKSDGTRALALALENWKVQREPADARLLAAAARPAGDEAAMKLVQDWMEESHIEDNTLSRLLSEPALK